MILGISSCSRFVDYYCGSKSFFHLPETAPLQRTEYTDEQFNKLNKSDCRLAVYLSPEKISWSVLDVIHHRVVSLTNFQFAKEQSPSDFWNEAARLFNEHKLGQQSFGHVTIAVDTGENVLVPQELFVENEINAYLNFSVSEPEQAVNDFIEHIPAFNVYGIHNNFLESLRSVFEKFDLLHVATPFVSNILRENKNLQHNRLFAHLAGSRLHLAAMQNGAFAFYNSYPVHTKEDFSYYLLAVAEELSFHPEEISVLLSGDITPDTQFYQTAKRFLQNVEFAERPKALKYSSKLEAVPRHLHSLLFSIHLCA